MESTESYKVVRAKPSDAADIAEFVARATRGRVDADRQSVLDRFASKGFWLVRNASGGIVGLAGWRAENLLARIDDFLIFPPELYPSAGKALVDHIEAAAKELQCEACMVFVPARVSPRLVNFYRSCGYAQVDPEGLPRVWQESIQEALTYGRNTMLRKLREDLILRPI
jgi:N-acetylglutamate synthase-like GNAT family acetyltransferase